MKKDNFDQDEQITIDDEEQAELIEKNALLLRKTAYQGIAFSNADIFNGYYYEESVAEQEPPPRKSQVPSNKV